MFASRTRSDPGRRRGFRGPISGERPEPVGTVLFGAVGAHRRATIEIHDSSALVWSRPHLRPNGHHVHALLWQRGPQRFAPVDYYGRPRLRHREELFGG